MFIYSFQYFFVYFYLIATAQVGHPLLFEIILKILNHLRTHVGVIIGALYFLAEYSIDRVIRINLGLSCLFEYHLVDSSIVAGFEYTFLYAYAYDRVWIECGAESLIPLVEGKFLHTVLYSLYVLFGLNVIGNTLIAWLFPGVVLLVCIKPCLKCSLD